MEVKEKHRLVASGTHPYQVSNGNLGMCLDQESNPQPFGVWDDASTNRANWPWRQVHILLADKMCNI